MKQVHLSKAQQLNLWDSGIEIKSISKSHHVLTLTLWEHADDKHNAPINIVAYEAKEVSTTPSQLKTGDFVKVVNGAFQNYFAFITGVSYGDEIEIKYFEKRGRYYILWENDLDSRYKQEKQLVAGILHKTRSHYSFQEQQYFDWNQSFVIVLEKNSYTHFAFFPSHLSRTSRDVRDTQCIF